MSARVFEMCGGLESVNFAAGDLLMEEGTRTGLLYFLKSGSLEVVHGETPLVTITRPGSIVGEISGLLDLPHAASVFAREPAVCFVARDAKAFLRDHPEVTLFLAEVLASRVRAMMRYLADLKVQYADRKDHLCMVDEMLLDLAHHMPKF